MFLSILFVHFYISIAVFSIYYHRGIAHGLLKFSLPFEHFCRFIFYTVGIGTNPYYFKYMAAQHRYHHKTSDSELDMNSPYHRSFISYFGKNTQVSFDMRLLDTLANDVSIKNDWIQNNLYSKYKYGGAILMGIIYFMFTNIVFAIIGTFLSYMLGTKIVPIIADYVLHSFGYNSKNNKDTDKSRNLFPIGILLTGEELHSNHHNNPKKLNLAVKWYEFDIGYYYIKFLSKYNFVTIVKE